MRIIFIRHGESMWNLVFNRGFGPSFLVRLVKAVLYELYLIPFDDSCFLDSPLSDLGFEQCHSLQAFLRNPCLDPAAQADFDVLTAGEGRSVIVSSQLRRAAATAAIGLADRLKRTNEPILMHSSCQEISRNFDTLSITEAGKGPVLRGSVELERKLHYDGTANKGSKSLGFRGMHRIEDFAAWAAKRNESTLTARTTHPAPTRHRPDVRAPRPARWLAAADAAADALCVSRPCRHDHRGRALALVQGVLQALLAKGGGPHVQEEEGRQLRRGGLHPADGLTARGDVGHAARTQKSAACRPVPLPPALPPALPLGLAL